MARPRKFLRFDDLPLFATDADLATAVVGPDPEKRATWLAALPLLKTHGFPRKTTTYGRYRPAVKDFYDRFYCVTGVDVSSKAQDGMWASKRRGLLRPEVDKK